MNKIIDGVLGVGEETDSIKLIGKADLVISGLTAGSVKLQYKLRPTDNLTSPAWTDYPNGSYTADTFTSIEVNDHGTEFKLVGVTNNAGVYARLSFNTRD